MKNVLKTFVQFGAGNIGRSFIGRLFAEAGYEVVFIDVDSRLVSLLNERRSYPVVVKQNDRPDEIRMIDGVRAIDGRDRQAVIDVLAHADGVATSVGQRGLQAVLPLLAAALEARATNNAPPLDVIIAENLRSGAAWFRQNLRPLLPESIDLDRHLGLVETSIGKMVPIMPAQALKEDPLQLFAEPYDTLIVDRLGFRGEIPALAGLKPVSNIAAWVDRKLFLHNMSHAALAYLGYQADTTLTYCWQAMELPAVVDTVRGALLQSASALTREYPDDLPQQELAAHADDLLSRYRNRALGDTLHRVGRDLARKLARDDRMIGACLLAARHGLPFDCLAAPIRAALNFAAPDEYGRVWEPDQRILQAVAERGPSAVLSELAVLEPQQALDRQVLQTCFPE